MPLQAGGTQPSAATAVDVSSLDVAVADEHLLNTACCGLIVFVF